MNCLLLYKYSTISELSATHAYNISAATVSIGDNKLHVTTIYQPQWSSIDNLTSLIRDISRLIQPSVSLILFGNFNLPRINWFDPCKTPCDGLHDKFQTFVDQNCLSQLSFRTRSDVTLDLVLVSDDICVVECSQLPSIGNSEHKIQQLIITTRRNIQVLDKSI